MKKLISLLVIVPILALFQNCEGRFNAGEQYLAESNPPSVNEDPGVEVEKFTPEEKIVADSLSRSLEVYITRAVNNESYAHWSISDKLNGLIEGYKYSSNYSFLKRAFTELKKLQEIRSQNLAIQDFVHNKPVPALISNDYTCGYFYANLVQNMIIIEKGAYILYELLKNDQLLDSDINLALRIVEEYDNTFEHFTPQFQGPRNAYAYSGIERQILKNCSDVTLTNIHPLNMNTAAGLAHFHMYRLHSFLKNLDLKSFHKARFVSISNLVKDSLNLNSSNGLEFYTWRYVEDGRIEDTNHALLTVNFIMTLHQNGWAFKKDFLLPLVETYFFILNNRVAVRSHLSEDYGSLVPLNKYHRIFNEMTSLCLIDNRVYKTSLNLALEHGEPSVYSFFSREKFKTLCSNTYLKIRKPTNLMSFLDQRQTK